MITFVASKMMLSSTLYKISFLVILRDYFTNLILMAVQNLGDEKRWFLSNDYFL